MKIRILNEEPQGNLIVLCYADTEKNSILWDHEIAPRGALECHVIKENYIVIMEAWKYNE